MHITDRVIVPIILNILFRAQVSRAGSDPASYPCPNLDASPIKDTTGSSYNIQCSTDYPGNDLPSVHTDTFEECMKACDTYVPGSSAEAHDFASCVGVSWGAGNPSANCYLKYQITSINRNDVGFSSGYQANYTLPNAGVTSQGSSSSTTSAPATSTPYTSTSTTSTIQPTPAPNSGPDGHGGIGVGAGVGVGVGVVVGSAILAGIFYLIWRRPKRRPEELVELSAEKDKKSDKLRELSTERRIDELPAEEKPGELFDPRMPRAELSEIRGTQARTSRVL